MTGEVQLPDDHRITNDDDDKDTSTPNKDTINQDDNDTEAETAAVEETNGEDEIVQKDSAFLDAAAPAAVASDDTAADHGDPTQNIGNSSADSNDHAANEEEESESESVSASQTSQEQAALQSYNYYKRTPSSAVRFILKKFVTQVSAEILQAAASTNSFWKIFNLVDTGLKDMRTRQCAMSLERLGKGLIHIKREAVQNDNEDDDNHDDDAEWDEKHCSELVGLFVDVLCTWTGLSVVSDESLDEDGKVKEGASFVYTDELKADMMYEMGVEPHQLVKCINCAQTLIAHGCMDGIKIQVKFIEKEKSGDALSPMSRLPKSMMKNKDADQTLLRKTAVELASTEDDEGHVSDFEEVEIKYEAIEMLAVDRIADAVFSTDLSSEEVELSALKFFLTAASRTVNIQSNDVESLSKVPTCDPHAA